MVEFNGLDSSICCNVKIYVFKILFSLNFLNIIILIKTVLFTAILLMNNYNNILIVIAIHNLLKWHVPQVFVYDNNVNNSPTSKKKPNKKYLVFEIYSVISQNS